VPVGNDGKDEAEAGETCGRYGLHEAGQAVPRPLSSHARMMADPTIAVLTRVE
jgi:hypothetical protein